MQDFDLEAKKIIKTAAKDIAVKNLWLYKPYPKQLAFHNSLHREKAFFAGNQLGKTLCGCYDLACDLLGIYPDWWEGFKYDRPIKAWVGGVTGLSTRDVLQFKLFGNIKGENKADGVIHHDYIDKITWQRGIPDAVDTIFIKGKFGISEIQFKSYEQGREKWQGAGVDRVLLDEEPPIDIYVEALARTNATKGGIATTMSPIKGMTDVALRFSKEISPDRLLITMGINEAEHYTEEEKKRIIDSYPSYERQARAYGIPTVGSGRVFPLSQEQIECHPLDIPDHWARIVGIDFGWDHPTAAAWLAWDRDTDTVYVYDCYTQGERSVDVHARVIRAKGDWIPVAWPHDGLAHDKGSGEQLAQQYIDEGVNMLDDRATFADGSNGVEAGVSLMLTMMEQGRLKVSKHLQPWFDEFLLYHRENGRIVKIRDDLLSATRYGIMMLRKAEEKPKGSVTKWVQDFSFIT